MALEDLDVARNEICTLKKNLNVADDFINDLKDQDNISRKKWKELMDKLKKKEDQIMAYRDKS